MVVYAPPPPPPSCPLSAVSLSYEDELWTHRLTAGPLERPSNCSWYRESSCCSSEDVLRLSHADPVLSLVGSSLHCRDQLHQLMCSICSPAQADLYIVEDVRGFDVPVLRVCESFWETLFAACGGATQGASSAAPPPHRKSSRENGVQRPPVRCANVFEPSKWPSHKR